MLNSNYVITLGLSELQNQIIRDHVENLKCELVLAGGHLDLISGAYFLSIVDRKALDEQAVRELAAFYTDVDGNLTERIILGADADDLAEPSQAQVFASFASLEKDLEHILQKAHQKAKKSENTIDNLSYAIIILNQVSRYPGITTARLARKINRNAATVRRMLEALRVMGEKIEYNPLTKGWMLQNGRSVLTGDLDLGTSRNDPDRK